jgi:hypothetical protein
MKFLFLYYRSIKEKVGGTGRLIRLHHCLGGKVIDTPIANEYIMRNIGFYIFQNIILLLKTIKYIKEIANYNIVIYQPYSLPGSIIPLLIKYLQRRIVIVDDVNFHSLIEPLLLKLFSKFIHVIWTSSLYTISQFRYYFKSKFHIHYIYTPILPKYNLNSIKINLILFVGSKSFERYVEIASQICHLAKDMPNFKFVFVGVASEALRGKCHYQNAVVLGRVPDEIYSQLLKLARYVIVIDNAKYIYPGGMLIKLIDALEYGAYPIVSWQFRYSFPFLKTVNSITDIYTLIENDKSFQLIEYFVKLFSCKNLYKFLKSPIL